MDNISSTIVSFTSIGVDPTLGFKYSKRWRASFLVVFSIIWCKLIPFVAKTWVDTIVGDEIYCERSGFSLPW